MHTPPNWLQKLLEWCCPPNRLDVIGDFEEWYHELVEEKGRWNANVNWLFQSLSILRLKALTQKATTQYIMIGLNIKLAKRNLLKNKLYTGINALGLTVGIAVCALIGLFIQDELSYDKHFKDYENVYRIAGKYQQGGDAVTISTLTAFLIQPFMQNQIEPDIYYTRLDIGQLFIKVGEKNFWEEYSVSVDSNFFDVFQTKFISGDPASVLDNPTSVVLDFSTAAKFFVDKNALGETLEIDGRSYVVTGVIEDLPSNTHFEAHIFIPISSVVESYPQWMTNTYGGVSHRTYFRAPNNYDVPDLEYRLNESIAKFYKGEKPPAYFFQNLKDIHLKSNLTSEIQVNGSLQTLVQFFITAIIILLLGCINFINLTIAGSLKRLKEVGVKKVLGASRKSQISQFQFESLLVGGFASVLAVLLIELALPTFNQIAGKELVLGLQEDLLIFLTCLGLIVTISIVVGYFPALFLLKVPTQNALRGATDSSKKRRLQPRNILVGIQFFLATILISSTLIILDQLTFMRNKDLGIDTSQIVSIPFQSPEAIQNFELMKEELLRLPSVEVVTASTSGLAGRVGGWRQYKRVNDTENVNIPTAIVAHDYFKAIEAEFESGRDFDEAFESDYTEAYIINEAAANFLDLEDPVGQKLKGSAFTGSEWSTKDARIIGVVKDFHFASLHSKIRPVVFSLSSEITYPMTRMFVKLKPGEMLQSMEKIEAIWNEVNTDVPFRYLFINEVVQQHYEQEARFFNVFSAFSSLSIFIGCIGLFGLTAFIMKRRTKEIGIRKVLGASQVNLLSVLSKDFIKMVLIACFLGIPVTIWFMLQWLQNFEYRIGIEWWVFGLTTVGALLATMLSIIYHSLKVSHTNPIESIRYE